VNAGHRDTPAAPFAARPAGRAGPPSRHPPGDLDLAGARRAVDHTLRCFVEDKIRDAPHPDARPLIEHLRRLLEAGGKRIRPALCVIGWHAAGGTGTPPQLSGLAAAVEMFHAAALIHDDIIDRSATRHGIPSAHHALRAYATAPSGRATATWFGDSAALVLGDLALSWSDQLLHRAGLDATQTQAVVPLFGALRTEALTGCYVELLATGHPRHDAETAIGINHLKTAKYTVERPLQLGAVLGGAGRTVLDTCAAYGLPLGEAFQLRDDVLGVFGDTTSTGKPALDDLREGKPTLLLALALSHATPGQRELLHRFVGDPSLEEEGAATVREILTETGARQEVEHRIEAQRLKAVTALHGQDLPADTVGALHDMADAVTRRNA
jgi:geranylgeranyl diphosphate synthase type I